MNGLGGMPKTGAQALQGYMFAPPLPVDEYLAWLKKHEALQEAPQRAGI